MNTQCLTSHVAGALSYAELGTVVNKSGGEFSFYQSAFADIHKFWGPLPSFIYSWVSIMYVRPAEVAIIILTFSEYSIRPFSLWAEMSTENEALLKKIVSILVLGEDWYQTCITWILRKLQLVFLIVVGILGNAKRVCRHYNDVVYFWEYLLPLLWRIKNDNNV